jgi:hypothetical protein
MPNPEECGRSAIARGCKATDSRFLAAHGGAVLIWPGTTVTVLSLAGGRSVLCTRSASFIAAILSLAVLLAAASPQSARAASWLEMNFFLSGPRYEGVMPPCDYPDALIKISSRFNNRENSFWNTDLKIIAFERIRETAYRPWAANTIPRRFCSGLVEISDGSKRAIHYSIAEDTGIIGSTWGVEWCVVGLDRNWAYNPTCQMARP